MGSGRVVVTVLLDIYLSIYIHKYFRFIKSHFIGSGIDIPNWQFTGSTIVTPNYVRLTPDLQSKQGAIWNSVVSVAKLKTQDSCCKSYH